MTLQIGQLVANRYRVDKLLGAGAAAEVYKVWDNQRATYLALKLLRSELGQIPDLLSRFQEEAYSLSSLQHPNIVRFYEMVQKEGMIFFLMDFIDGNTLRQEIRQDRPSFTMERILSILRPICSALQYAHHQKIIHCDIKPENILIDLNGHVLLSDFGIAAMAGSYIGIPGGIGTPAYMAPEQIQDGKVLPQTDLYAVGIILFELLTGSKPFRGEIASIQASQRDRIRWEQVHLPPPLPCSINPALPSGIDLVVTRCLEKNPNRRFSNALELLHAIETLELKQKSTTDPALINKNITAGQIERPQKPFRMKSLLPIGGVSVIILIVVMISINSKNNLETSPNLFNTKETFPAYKYPSSCMDIVFNLQPKTYLHECITSISVHQDGTLQVYLDWKVSSLSNSSGVVVQADTDNHNMYLLDDLGNRLDHIATGGGTDQKVELFNGQSKQGWFMFPQANPKAASFYFIDDDNKVRSPRLERKWP